MDVLTSERENVRARERQGVRAGVVWGMGVSFVAVAIAGPPVPSGGGEEDRKAGALHCLAFAAVFLALLLRLLVPRNARSRVDRAGRYSRGAAPGLHLCRWNGWRQRLMWRMLCT